MRRSVSFMVAGGTIAVLVIAGCADDSDSGVEGDDALSDPQVIVATTGIWADVVGNVVCDGSAAVTSLLPPGADPHAFEPSLADRAEMEEATLVVANGLGLEEGLADTIDAVESSGTVIFRIGDHVDALAAGGDEEHGEEDHGEEEHGEEDHDHGGDNPHIWFDPTRVAGALPELGDALVDVGLDRTTIDECVAAYETELEALDEEVETILGEVPAEGRVLVTNHDSFSYLADRYGYEVVGTVIPGTSSLAEAGPASLEALATTIADHDVPAIFAETQHADDDARALADRIGDVEIVTLLAGTLGEPDSGADTYVGLLLTDARLIADALAPS